jgi:hypothetical protein
MMILNCPGNRNSLVLKVSYDDIYIDLSDGSYRFSRTKVLLKSTSMTWKDFVPTQDFMLFRMEKESMLCAFPFLLYRVDIEYLRDTSFQLISRSRLSS